MAKSGEEAKLTPEQQADAEAMAVAAASPTGGPARRSGKIVHHADVKAMGTIAEAMDSLDNPEDVDGVIAWFNRKYPAKAPAGGGGDSQGRANAQ